MCSDCVGAQAGVLPGDIILSANKFDLAKTSGCEAQKAILKIVTDLELVIKRKKGSACARTTGLNQTPFKLAREVDVDSPRKVPRNAICYASSGDSETSSEDGMSDSLELSEELHGSNRLNNRLRGMDAHLKFDDGIKECKIVREGRDFVYSGSVLVTISGRNAVIFFLPIDPKIHNVLKEDHSVLYKNHSF